MRLKRAKRANPEVNMVPMIDCVFQLQIFFLIATQVKKNEVAALELPISRRASEVKEGDAPLIINIVKPTVNKDRPFIVLGETLNLEGFKQFMKSRQAFCEAEGRDLPILRIRADKDSQFEEIQKCLIACRDVGIWQVRLSTIKRLY